MSSFPHRLAVFLPNLASGGAERVHINLAPAFQQAGIDVTFLLQQDTGSLRSEVSPGVRIVSLDCPRTVQCIVPLVKFLRRERPEFLISNLGHNNLISILAKKISGAETKVIVTQHSALSAESVAYSGWKYRSLPWLCRLLLPRADGIISVSSGVADDLATTARLPRDSIDVINNPVVLPDFDRRRNAPLDHPWFAPNLPPVIVAAGRLAPQKDFGTLIDAFALVRRTVQARLMILGEGGMLAELQCRAAAAGVAADVAFEGFQANPLPYIRQAALLVSSSRYEGFGNVLVEALACGTPVVSTDCPAGPAEILEGGRYGRLVPVGDVPALAAAMRSTLEEAAPRAELEARGRTFTVERSAEQYVAMFERLSPAIGRESRTASG